MDKAPSCEGAFFIGNIILALLITLVKIEVDGSLLLKRKLFQFFLKRDKEA